MRHLEFRNISNDKQSTVLSFFDKIIECARKSLMQRKSRLNLVFATYFELLHAI
jgi:hypothetical protein